MGSPAIHTLCIPYHSIDCIYPGHVVFLLMSAIVLDIWIGGVQWDNNSAAFLVWINTSAVKHYDNTFQQLYTRFALTKTYGYWRKTLLTKCLWNCTQYVEIYDFDKTRCLRVLKFRSSYAFLHAAWGGHVYGFCEMGLLHRNVGFKWAL